MPNSQSDYLYDRYNESELVIGIVVAAGTSLSQFYDELRQGLTNRAYEMVKVKVSGHVIQDIEDAETPNDPYERVSYLMDSGNKIREGAEDASILALLSAQVIGKKRGTDEQGNRMPLVRHSFIIDSLKHPEEVERLREIYSEGFYLIAVHSSIKRRVNNLISKGMSEEQAKCIIERDTHEPNEYGQHTRDTYHLADFFLEADADLDKLSGQVQRVLDLIFGHPYLTPTFDEFAMFMAYSASLRSADLSRQVGAVVAKGDNIVSTGANDVPKRGGGLYWPTYEPGKGVIDEEGGRDYKIGEDSNDAEKRKIIDDVLSNAPESRQEELRTYLLSSRIMDIMEYGRAVHAEMEALMACARSNVSCDGALLFTTTFPCHNCAKHIIAAGISRVTYVEPFPKSRAEDLHEREIGHVEFENDQSAPTGRPSSLEGRVELRPFVGVGPRSFFDVFSMKLGNGYPLLRKKEGKTIPTDRKYARLRRQLLPCSYLEREVVASYHANEGIKKLKGEVPNEK